MFEVGAVHRGVRHDAERLWSDILSVAILIVQRLMVTDVDADKKNGQLQGKIECWPTEADRKRRKKISRCKD